MAHPGRTAAHPSLPQAPCAGPWAATRAHGRRALWAMLCAAALAGCDGPAPASAADPAQSEAAAALRDAPAEHVFEGSLGGSRVSLLVHDCALYQFKRQASGGVQWQRILAPEPYPFWTSCVRQSIALEKNTLTVELGRMAFGAGGCCATGGTYRSKDGRTWEKAS